MLRGGSKVGKKTSETESDKVDVCFVWIFRAPLPDVCDCPFHVERR